MDMTPAKIRNRFGEYARLQTELNLPPPDLIEIAFFIEDSFDIRLTDSEIVPENMGDLDTAERFVMRKLTPAKGVKPK